MSEIIAKQHMGLTGHYKIKTKDAYGNVKQETPWFGNLVTNLGLESLTQGEGADYVAGTNTNAGLSQFRFSRGMLLFGTGTTPPQVTDTALENQVYALDGRTFPGGFINEAVYNAEDETQSYVESLMSYTDSSFPETLTITEVGVRAVSNSHCPLFSRSLIKDANGNPSSITIDQGDYVEVTYRLRAYPFLNGITEGQVAGYTYKFAPMNFSTRWALLFRNRISPTSASLAVRGSITDFSLDENHSINNHYGRSDFYLFPVSSSISVDNGVLRLSTTASFGSAEGNYANGISGISLPWLWGSTLTGMDRTGSLVMAFDPPIPKDDTKVLIIKFEITFGNYNPED